MFISLDLETTGFDPIKDKIIEFGAIKFDLDGEKERMNFLINPGITLPQVITHITGITDKDLSMAPSFREKAEEIKKFLGDLPIVGHNILFDISFLRANNIEITNPDYDTCRFASIMLPGLPSYSLEILSHTLKLEHKEKHRATADAIASMELFLNLTDKFCRLPNDLFEKIKSLCKKTAWPLKDFLLGLKPKEQIIEGKEDVIKEKIVNSPYSEIILKNTESTLFEIKPPYLNLIKNLSKKIDKDSYISIPNNIFKQITDSLPENIAKIDNPSNYLSLNRLEELEQKEHFDDAIFSALLKILIWKEKTKTGHLGEITFFNEEKSIIPLINIQTSPNEEYFFKKALEKDSSSPAVCSHSYLAKENPKCNELLIFNSEQFINSIFYSNSEYLNLDILLNQLKIFGENDIIKSLSSATTIIFGLIGLFFEKYNDHNDFFKKSVISEEHLLTSMGRDICSAVANLIESSKALSEFNNAKNKQNLNNFKSSLKILQDTFIKPDLQNKMIWIEKDFSENIVIRIFPLSIKEYVQKIIGNSKTYKIISENIDLIDNGNFTKDLLGLDKEIPLIKTDEKREDAEIFITKDSSDEKDILLKFLIEYLNQKKGHIAIIFNSKQQLNYYTLALSKNLNKNNIKIVSQLTGSLGKLREKFKQDPDNSVLLITPNFWENFKDQNLIETLLIHKIPFDPPSLPYIIAASKNYNNPFIEFQIPRAIFSLKKIISHIPYSPVKKEVVILDSRLIEKDYGETIINNLKNLATTKIINLSILVPNVK